MKRILSASLALLGLIAAGLGQDAPAPARLQQKFSEADKNQDGVITVDEFDRPRVFRRLDTDGDGRLTPQEAREAVQTRRNEDAKEPLASTTTGEKAFQEHLDIPYAKISGVDPKLLSLDIYTPGAPAETGGYPVVLMMHGGGWRTGDKANGAIGREKAAFFSANGYIYVSVNYRLSPAVRHPAHAEDVAKAIAWVVGHIKEYGGDPDRITLMGHSAGAHLAALVATDERLLIKAGAVPANVKGVILLDTAGYDIPRNLTELSEGPIAAGIYKNAFGVDRQTWVDASPISYVKDGKKFPPFLIFYTDRKSSGTLSKEFAAALQKTGAPASSVLAAGKSHSAINRDIGQPGDGPSKLILEFLKGAKSFPESI